MSTLLVVNETDLLNKTKVYNIHHFGPKFVFKIRVKRYLMTDRNRRVTHSPFVSGTVHLRQDRVCKVPC